MKKILLLLIAVLIFVGCTNKEEEKPEDKLVFDDTLYCNVEASSLTDCIAFYKDTIVIGDFNYFDETKTDLKEPFITYSYKMENNKIKTEANIKYLEDSKMLNYEGTKYEKNESDYKQVKKHLDKLYKISGNTSKSEYMYCSSLKNYVSSKQKEKYKYFCYSFNFDKTIDYAKVTINNEIVHGISIYEDALGEGEFGIYTLIKGEDLIYQYNKNSNTYSKEVFKIDEEFLTYRYGKYKKCTDILNCDID